MFTELYAVAKHTPLQISVSPDGARLNVLIIPKPGDDADEGSALTKPIQAVGTPEELDRELPAKLAEYCAAINDLRLKIDMPIEAITAEAGKEDRQKKKAAKVPHAPAPKKKAAPKPVKPAKSAAPVKAAQTIRRERRTKELAAGRKAAEQKAAATQDNKATTQAPAGGAPNTSSEVLPNTAGPTSAAAPTDVSRDNPAAEIAFAQARRAQELASAKAEKKSKRATREECLADLRTYLAECASTNVSITRALFLSHNTTARSYERKFKSWDEFLAEGRKAPDEWEDKFPVPGDALQKSGDDTSPAKATASRTVIDPSMKWPFPGSHEAAPATKRIDRVIYLHEEGHEEKMLGTSAVPLAIGDKYNHIQLGDLRVFRVQTRTDGSERISVKPWSEESAPAKTSATKPRLKLTADGPAPAGDTAKAEV